MDDDFETIDFHCGTWVCIGMLYDVPRYLYVIIYRTVAHVGLETGNSEVNLIMANLYKDVWVIPIQQILVGGLQQMAYVLSPTGWFPCSE